MINEPAEKRARDEFRKIAAQIRDMDIQKLVRSDLDVAINFENARPLFQRLQEYCSVLASLEFRFPNADRLALMQRELTKLRESLQATAKFDLREGNSKQDRDRIVQEIDGRWVDVFNETAEQVALARITNSDLERELKGIADAGSSQTVEWKKKTEEFDRLIQDLQERQKRVAKESEEALSAARKAAVEIGVSQEAGHFSEEAKGFWWNAFWWLCGGIVTFGCTLFAIFYLLDVNGSRSGLNPTLTTPTVGTNIVARDAGQTNLATTGQPHTTAMVIERAFPRLAVLSLLVSAIVFCFKNFSSARHNYVVNNHRAVALTTFQTFLNGTADPKVKDAILLQAAQSVFAPQRSGYLKDEAEPPQITYISDVFKGVSGEK